MTLRPIAIACIAAGLIACGEKTEIHHADGHKAKTCAEDGGVSINDAWVRATPSASGMSAAFFTVCNGGGEAVDVVSVTTPVAGVTELHETTRSAEGVVAMQPVSNVSIAAGDSAAFEPGGKHVMLTQLNGAIEDGAEVPITVTLTDGVTIDVVAKAKSPAKAAGHNH